MPTERRGHWQVRMVRSSLPVYSSNDPGLGDFSIDIEGTG